MVNRGGGRGDGQGGGQRKFFGGGDPGAGPSGFAGQGNFQEGGGGYQTVDYDYGDPRNGGGRGFQGTFSNQGGGPLGGYDFHPGAGGPDFYGGNGNNGYRNRRRYEFRGNRASGSTYTGRGGGRVHRNNTQVHDVVEHAEVQQRANTTVSVQQPTAPEVVQRPQVTNITYRPKKIPSKTSTIQQPRVKPTTVQQKIVRQMATTGDDATAVAVNAVSTKVTKKKDKDPEKLKCFRCDVVGHFSIDCTAEICDFCESAEHANKDCPLHSAPKPVLSVYGYGQEELIFMEVQPTPSYRPKSDNGRMGRITITGGSLPIEKIVERLRWVVDDSFQWDIQPQGNNVYKTQFRNKMELARATSIGLFQVKGTTCSMEITEWKSATKPTRKLEEVWVLISGVPDGMLRNYLMLWGLGGLIGKTKEIDMAYTRRHGVVRSLVKVVDIAHIPYQKEFWYDDEGYILTIEVEDYDMAIDGDDPKDDSEHDDGNDDAENKEKNKDADHSEDMSKSDKKNEGSQKSKSGGVIINAVGARTVPLHYNIPFGSFSSVLVHGKDHHTDVSPNTCRRLFSTPPESPKGTPSATDVQRRADLGTSEKVPVVGPISEKSNAAAGKHCDPCADVGSSGEQRGALDALAGGSITATLPLFGQASTPRLAASSKQMMISTVNAVVHTSANTAVTPTRDET
ncbi:hypothetical protein ACQ4PT_062008 [Festuca glaucescens]